MAKQKWKPIKMYSQVKIIKDQESKEQKKWEIMRKALTTFRQQTMA